MRSSTRTSTVVFASPARRRRSQRDLRAWCRRSREQAVGRHGVERVQRLTVDRDDLVADAELLQLGVGALIDDADRVAVGAELPAPSSTPMRLNSSTIGGVVVALQVQGRRAGSRR